MGKACIALTGGLGAKRETIALALIERGARAAEVEAALTPQRFQDDRCVRADNAGRARRRGRTRPHAA